MNIWDWVEALGKGLLIGITWGLLYHIAHKLDLIYGVLQ
jgi:hypothetical protein